MTSEHRKPVAWRRDYRITLLPDDDDSLLTVLDDVGLRHEKPSFMVAALVRGVARGELVVINVKTFKSLQQAALIVRYMRQTFTLHWKPSAIVLARMARGLAAARRAQRRRLQAKKEQNRR